MLNKAENTFIARANSLRSPAFAIDSSIGCEYVRAQADGWRRQGLAGLRAACWTLAELVKDIPGSWDVYVTARNLAAE